MLVAEFIIRFALVAAFTLAAQAVLVPAMPTVPEAVIIVGAVMFSVTALFR